ncbi:MAG: ASCH domain-containing protein [Ilumatobacteraceae bacterium]
MSFPIINGLRSIEFGTRGESRSRLINHVINGSKRATAGLRDEYFREGEPIEHIGEKLAMIDNDMNHVATLVVTRVEERRFADVPDEFAIAEAEGDLNAADFRVSHWNAFRKQGINVDSDTEMVLIYFDLLPLRTTIA